MLTLTNYHVNSGLDKAQFPLPTTIKHSLLSHRITNRNFNNLVYFKENSDIIRAHRVNACARRDKSKRLSLSSYNPKLRSLLKLWWFAGAHKEYWEESYTILRVYARSLSPEIKPVNHLILKNKGN